MESVMIDIRLFGPGRVHTPTGVLDRGDLDEIDHWRVLRLLAVHRALGTSALAELLWDGNPPAGHVAALAGCVSALNRRLGPVVLTHADGFALDQSRVTVDLWHFDDLLDRARGGPAPRALPLLERALGLAGQLPVPEEAGRPWGAEVRDRYRARVVAAATSAARHALAVGAAQQAHDHAAFATDLDPAAEDAWRVRMSALAAVGDRAGARRCFHACRQILADERGIDPAPATGALFGNILRGGHRLPRLIAAR
jgi:DNA-binding SARP family transcriptional activator